MHDFSGMADAGGMGYPPSPLIGPWPRVFGCGAGVFKHQPFALLVCSIQGPRAIISLSDARLAYLTTILFDSSNGELVDVLPPSEAEDYSVTVSRGCTDSNAGCWAGGSALGDMQFAGTGTATGSWPYRNSYTTGNKSGQITFAINGVTYTPVAAGPWMRIATADGSGVDGVSVTRW